MSLCKDCTNAGLCVVFQKLKEETLVEFPDGKVAIVAMENALLSCDHFTPIPLSASGSDVESESFYADTPDYGYIGDGIPPQNSPARHFEENQRIAPTQRHAPVQTRTPPPMPETGEVITYGPGGEVRSSPAGAMPGLFSSNDLQGSSSYSGGMSQRRKLNLANMGGLSQR